MIGDLIILGFLILVILYLSFIISTMYYEKDLISFGNYVLSEDRINRYSNYDCIDDSSTIEGLLCERLSVVNDADLANWLDIKDE